MDRKSELICPKCKYQKTKTAIICYRCRGHNRVAIESTMAPAIQRKDIDKLIKSIKINKELSNEEKNVLFRNRVLISILYLSGARITEVLSLKKENFDFDRPKSVNYLIK